MPNNFDSEYRAMIAEMDQEIRLADYRERLGVGDNGRSLDELLEIAFQKTNLTTEGNKAMSLNILTDMIQTASTKAAFTEVEEQGTTYRRRMPQSQSDVRFLNLRELQIKETLNHSSVPKLAPAGSPGVISRIAPLTIAEHSRTIAAGANLMLVKQGSKPFNGKDQAGHFYESETVFILSEKARFDHVLEGQNAEESELPVHREVLNRQAVKTYIFSTTLSRRRAERFFAGETEAAVLRSIALGIASAADSALLNRIRLSGYSNPYVENSLLPIETFSLAKVSALGLRFGDLSAIIGSAANGASISEDGRLTASGIKAEFCDAIPETIIGKFSDSAITIGENITLIANSSGANALNGEMAITCICEIGTLIPINGLKLPFWLVGA